MTCKNPKFNGLTDDQALMLFEKIAMTTYVIADLCRAAAQRHGHEEVASTFHALDTMICSVGALADHAAGGNCVGGFAAWIVGPSFDETQKGGGAV